jgi:hypothetical protein
MNNAELDRLLKTVPVPKRPQSYWDEFPGRVLGKAHWAENRAQSEADSRSRERRARFRLRFVAVVGVALVAAGLAIGFAFGLHKGHRFSISDSELAMAQKWFREIETVFPKQVQAIVIDRQGPHIVLADKANLPVSMPLCLKICGTGGDRLYITFSGQEVSVDGELCEVLQDGEGNVLLVGKRQVWSSGQAQEKLSGIEVAARSLTTDASVPTP